MMTFFASFNTDDLAFMPRLEDVFDLYTKMLLGMGLVFQMPTVVLLPREDAHGDARGFLLKHSKYAFLHHLHRRRRHHADRRHGDAGDLRCADGWLFTCSASSSRGSCDLRTLRPSQTRRLWPFDLHLPEKSTRSSPTFRAIAPWYGKRRSRG